MKEKHLPQRARGFTEEGTEACQHTGISLCASAHSVVLGLERLLVRERLMTNDQRRVINDQLRFC